MVYQFKYDLRALDLWQLTMNKIYRSIAGVCNFVYTIAFLLVTVKLWKGSHMLQNMILIVLCSLFVIVQPIAIYLRAKKQVARLPKDMEVGLNEFGIHIMSSNQSSHVSWKSLKMIRREKNMMIFCTDSVNGVMIPNRILKSIENEIWNYVSMQKMYHCS